MGDIHALDGTLFILVGLAPRDILVPVQVGRDGITILVLLNFEGFIAAIGRVCQTLADDAVAHPHHKLSVLGVADFRLVHPETVHTDVTNGESSTPQGVAFFNTYAQRTLRNTHHAKWCRLGKRCAAHSCNLTACSHRIRLGTGTGVERCRGNDTCQIIKNNFIFHIRRIVFQPFNFSIFQSYSVLTL